MKTFKKIIKQEIEAIVCDGCGLQASAESDYDFQEFISIEHHCGYNSIHGDGMIMNVDLCQQCFADMCGDTLRITDDNNSISEQNNKARVAEQLEYDNIFDAICKSKAEAAQLKEDSDLRLISRDILLKNKILNNHELSVALKRVEQLWDAQYQSVEGNELHQLADLICAYEQESLNR